MVRSSPNPATRKGSGKFSQTASVCFITDNWLRAGSHTFDFHFNLPPRLPSTFNSKIGHISYFVQALCMGREHILAKKRLYLLVQGISDFRQQSLIQVPRGWAQV